ncbi:hypothetical protein [Pedobacter endophyticus]|uniref:Uncharacterized protein n=1 Tax=Pedobacter endophyticus TaxID=2789740 RepID=A0A7S9PYW8_9SPHI|nr:hypothetical protein [Pedobacter endophyticus]QPH39007.1 hypothetical protein IZT61_18380 [Pedobacter endophyticus]
MLQLSYLVTATGLNKPLAHQNEMILTGEVLFNCKPFALGGGFMAVADDILLVNPFTLMHNKDQIGPI